jgi:signal transduction histidine kinase
MKRLLLVSLLGALLGGGTAGIAVVLYASGSFSWTLTFVLLTCFGAAAAVCLFLLGRLLLSSTQLRRANLELERRNAEAERATKAKSRFVANMSHELRTPLNAVIGFSELMQAGRSGPVSPSQREQLGIIRSSADHLLTLINEVLDLAQVEAGHLRLAPEPIEPAEIALECVNSMAFMAAQRNVEIEVDPLPIGTVTLDPARLRQVIFNYLSNALKFAGAGSRVTVAVTRGRDGILVEVTDTGPGITLADQRRVFDEFVQLDSAREGGSGLGLAVTKLIAQAQGGRVGVRSWPDAGCTFYAWLPAAAPPLGQIPTRRSSGEEDDRRRSPVTASRPDRLALVRH